MSRLAPRDRVHVSIWGRAGVLDVSRATWEAPWRIHWSVTWLPEVGGPWRTLWGSGPDERTVRRGIRGVVEQAWDDLEARGVRRPPPEQRRAA